MVVINQWFVSVSCLFLCFACSFPTDEQRAIEIIQREVSREEQYEAHLLGGGCSGSKVVLVQSQNKKFIVKFFKNPTCAQKEMHNSLVASDEGSGPRVYFLDSSSGIMISEFLVGKKMTFQDIRSRATLMATVELLKKIHFGPQFVSDYNPLRRVRRELFLDTELRKKYIPIESIIAVFQSIELALENNLLETPCHNDLHGGNLVFFDSWCRAIDFGDAGQNDPFYDMATIANTLLNTPEDDSVMLRAYFHRDATVEERTKLHCMRRLVLIKWICDRLNQLTDDDLARFDSIPDCSFEEFVDRSLAGLIDYGRSEDSLLCLRLLIVQLFSNDS